MAELELNFLGELEVVRNGEPLTLPPSRKTRALLAYLALQDRVLRREHLCELLWEIPDDPRGSLRWSLSKLRRLVDDDQHTRIIADRSGVAFNAAGALVDVAALHDLATQPLNKVAVETLEDAASRYRGNFLEGLEFSNFHDFHAWSMGQREQAARDQGRILRSLVDRLTDDPERALPHARALATLLPYDESARAALIRLLMALQHVDEAEQQYHLGKRMLDEVGASPSGALYAAWRGTPGATRPVAAASLTKSEPVPRDAALVGRDTEIRRIRDTLAQVVQGSAAMTLLIRGDPGMGKSRLLRSAAAAAAELGAAVIQASAFETETMRPFALWTDALTASSQDRTADGFFSDDRNDREALFQAIGGAIGRRCDAGSVLLAFDDMQWCDESSAAALHYATRINRDRPLLCLLAAREGELRDNGPVQQALRGLRHDGLLEELNLGPLPVAQIRQLIELCAPTADSDALSRQCAGNPLLAIELARAEAAGDSGGSLEELVRDRLTRLDVDGAEVLRWSSVLGPHIDIGALVRVSRMTPPRLVEALELARAAIHAGFATERGFRFSHDLIARAVYADICAHPAPRHASPPGRAAGTGYRRKPGPCAADLAHHAAQSGDPALAARAMVSAGRLCLRFFANDDALTLARKGLQLAERLADAERGLPAARSPRRHAGRCTAGRLAGMQPSSTYQLAEQALDHGALAHAQARLSDGQLRTLGTRPVVRRAGRNPAGRAGYPGRRPRIVSTSSVWQKPPNAWPCWSAICRRPMQSAAGSPGPRRAERTCAISPFPWHPACCATTRAGLIEAEALFKEARTLCKAAGDRVSEFQAYEYLVMIDLQRGAVHAARERCAALLEIGQRLRRRQRSTICPGPRRTVPLCSWSTSRRPWTTLSLELREVDAKYRLAYTA
jgi:DNA-binding SARP family transcriptional activator